ncbi:dienelactone hydrolase family protein [Sinomonas terrae]|uniref:Dienelactone hydrolase family protein n=1 Tax=Sinomonas terrae TaxID=2908838 RepID=A0ABS9U1U4_9MICC|nr:dienelactone hydrolase family protein [Sinomonas terrae]MCH6470664.1 dienelactone hydrolase family protein [Sinomonas terrae]
MAEAILFHHALGLTAGLLDFAEELRHAGHVVHTPDLFDGKTFDNVDDGVAHAEELGFGEILSRGARAVEDLAPGLVYVGYSLGVLPAQQLAQTRAGARAALLIAACVPVAQFGTTWPPGIPVQIHGKDADPYFAPDGDLAAARELIAMTPDADLFLYEGGEHFFADSSQPGYDSASAELLLERALTLMDTV